MYTTQLATGDALLVVDVQNDFLPGGRLAVRHGERVIAPLNAYIGRFARRGLPVFATRDWHPADHCSFAAEGGPWPTHCVADSEGAGFPAGLHLPPEVVVISKATRAGRDAYSGFSGTDLGERLRRAGVRRLFVGGLATDYCVLHTVIDACRFGVEVFVLEDAVRPVEAVPGDGELAMAAMREAGARPLSLDRIAE